MKHFYLDNSGHFQDEPGNHEHGLEELFEWFDELKKQGKSYAIPFTLT